MVFILYYHLPKPCPQTDPPSFSGINSFISENPLVSKVMHWLRITFVFILILFIDSVNRVYRVQLEVIAAGEQTSKGP